MNATKSEFDQSRQDPQPFPSLSEVVAHLPRTTPERAYVDETLSELGERLGQESAAGGRSISDAVDQLYAAAELEKAHIPQSVIVAVIRGYEDMLSTPERYAQARRPSPLSDHVTRLAALRRINQAATTSLDLDAMLQTVVVVVRETMICDSCSIFLVDDANATLVLRASVGLNSQANGHVFLPVGTGITGHSALTRQTLAVPDASEHSRYVDYPLIGDQRYTSQVSVPLALRSPDRLVGVLNILSLNRREFDADELAFLETAAGEMAIAIENARLYSQTDAELQRRISQLSTLQQMSRMVASTLELPQLLQLISEQATELSSAIGVEIYRQRRDELTKLELLSRHSPAQACSFEAVNLETRAIVDEVMRSLVSVWREVGSDGDRHYVNALPMLTGRRAVGAICVFHSARPPDDAETIPLLDAFCDAAAIAIENADLYEEARRGYTRTSILLQEMHHRVRNNLQTVAALLSMQARHADDPTAAVPLREAVTRIQSIAAIHDILSGGDFRETTVDVIAKHVADDAVSNLVGPELRVNFTIEPSDVHVNSREATVLALLINEFVMNAIGHGFAGRKSGDVLIRSELLDDQAIIEVVDDGVGIAKDFSLEECRRLGLNIARTLVQADLRGSLSLIRRAEGGTLVRVTFRPANGAPAPASP